MAVPPGDVAADHAVLFAVGGVVGAVEGELPQRGEPAGRRFIHEEFVGV